MLSRVVLLLLACVCGTHAFVLPAAPQGKLVSQPAVAPSTLTMTSLNKKAKAAQKKVKSSRAAAKRFKATSTGKLLRHYAGKAHLLRKKRPQKLAALRRVGSCDEAELKTYQKLLLVKPKRA